MSSPPVTNSTTAPTQQKSQANGRAVCNGYLSASPPDHMDSPSGRRRSTSVTPSERSSRSRITVVENDPDVASYHGPESHKSYRITKIYAPRYTWKEHLKGLFGIDVSKKKEPIIREEILASKVPEAEEMDDDYSPWVLPVYVLSSRKDTDKQHVPKEAKCTIDTGNQQGNIVSRDFVLNVLQFSQSNFKPLTEKEKRGAAGITDDTFIPENAVYLTWYHRKSTRVFRNMRFLISPYQHYDLIIGAHSIREHKLLDVPNLMAPNNGHIDKIAIKGQSEDSEKKRLERARYNADRVVKNLKTRITKKQTENEDTKDLEAQLVEAQKALALAQKELDDHILIPIQKAPSAKVAPSTDTTQSTGTDKQATPRFTLRSRAR